LELPVIPAGNNHKFNRIVAVKKWRESAILVAVLVAAAASAVRQAVLEGALDAAAVCGDVAGGKKGTTL
jgi:hypothetical protein